MIVNLHCPECDADLGPDVEFEPDVPPKPCMDPDHPAYSDPGSAGYCDGYPDRCPKCGTRIDADWAYNTAQQIFLDREEAAYEDAMLRKYEDRYDK